MALKKRLLLLLCITALTLITIDVTGSGSGPLGSIRSGVREVFSPLQKAVGAVTSPVGDFFGGITNGSELKKENRELKQELSKEKTKNQQYVGALSENEKLSKLLELNSSLGVKKTTARVVTGAPSNFESTIQIDHGTNDGIVVGDAVVEGNGLVGRIIETSSTRSTVLLLSDSSSGVGVRNSRTSIVGIAQGESSDDTLDMEFVAPDADIKKGDLVVTSGLQDGRFPANIPVATVKSVGKDPSGLSNKIVLTPLVKLSDVSVVSVLHTSDSRK
jgi:rod shape-determining protein MreC